MKNEPKLTSLGEVLKPVRRHTKVEPIAQYNLLGVRLDGRGPFLREIKLGSEISANTLYQVKHGDFIYSRLFAWRGAFGVIGNDLNRSFVSNEFPTFVPIRDRIDVKFLNYWFRLESVLKSVGDACSGSTPLTRNRYKEEYFLRIEIPLPPLSEQRRTVAKIEQLAAKIEEANELRSSVDDLIYAFTMSLHKRLSRSRIVQIKDLLELAEDKHAIHHDLSYPQVGIRGFGAGLFAKPAVKGSETKYRYFNRLKTDQVVLSQVKGWEGAIDVCPANLNDYYASPEYRTFNCKDAACHPSYFSHFIKTPWFHRLLGDATRGQGARRERTRPELFLSLELPMPKLSEQKRAAVLLQELGKIPISHMKTAAELNALLPSILDKAFKGEL